MELTKFINVEKDFMTNLSKRNHKENPEFAFQGNNESLQIIYRLENFILAFT
jgi:hypothetical protein